MADDMRRLSQAIQGVYVWQFEVSMGEDLGCSC